MAVTQAFALLAIPNKVKSKSRKKDLSLGSWQYKYVKYSARVEKRIANVSLVAWALIPIRAGFRAARANAISFKNSFLNGSL